MNFPDDTQRLSIVGATGSGKTQAAQWHLSHRNYHVMPWLVYDFKKDETLDIPEARHIDVTEVPTKPGIYITHPLPDDKDRVEDQMWEVWRRGNTGIYVDEGYMIGQHNPAFRSLLTQGRSKKIPMIVLSQRPVWMDPFVFSESEYFQVFRLQHARDRQNVEQFIPARLDKPLPEYHSYYYDVKANTLTPLRPVPDLETIHATFRRRLERLPKVI